MTPSIVQNVIKVDIIQFIVIQNHHFVRIIDKISPHHYQHGQQIQFSSFVVLLVVEQ